MVAAVYSASNDGISVEQEGGGSSITPPANPQGYIGGVDTISFSLWVEWSQNDFSDLMRDLSEFQKKSRQANKNEVTVEMFGKLWSVASRGSGEGAGYKFRLQCDGVRILFSTANNPQHRSNCMVQFYGGAMLRLGWDAKTAFEAARELIQATHGKIHHHSIARLDLFIDLPGVKSKWFTDRAEKGKFVKRASMCDKFYMTDDFGCCELISKVWERGRSAVHKAVDYWFDQGKEKTLEAVRKELQRGSMDVISYGAAEKGRGVQFGRGSKLIRIYDKIAQLERFHPERLPVMREAWGTDEATPVTRVEIQLRGDAMRRWGVTTVWDLSTHQTSMVRYMTSEWLVLLSKYDGKNKDRRRIHPVWRKLQKQFVHVFEGGRRRLVAPRHKPDERTTKRMVKTAIGLLKSASGRLYGACMDVNEFRRALHQMIEQGVRMCGGFDDVYTGHLEKLYNYWNALGEETEPHYPYQLWSRRPELVINLDSLPLLDQWLGMEDKEWKQTALSFS